MGTRTIHYTHLVTIKDHRACEKVAMYQCPVCFAVTAQTQQHSDWHSKQILAGKEIA